MQKNKNKKSKKFLIISSFIFFVFLIMIRKPYGTVDDPKEIKWGVAFSKNFCGDLGLDWRETYLALLDDLGVKLIRLPIYWSDAEPEKDKYEFSDYDWMVSEAEKRGVKLVLAIGRKVPRWPECHIPGWANLVSEEDQQKEVLEILPQIVSRYKNSESLYMWQVENEPFLDFGVCPKLDKYFLNKEVAAVKSEDPDHKILTTDSGELSIWVRAAKRGDVFGTTLYRTLWHSSVGYFTYPIGPRFFWLKANLVHIFFPGRPLVVSELQAEPWGHKSIQDMTIEEQFRTLSIEHFRANVEYAERVAFSEVYLWGAEWWYWMRGKKEHPEFWDYAKSIINFQ
ncbi:MAG: cellulase family glycosylhydrolase [bacterium]